ncbi:acyclic terpene utilization AtuA family protein [Umezawaea beigongshangensis]|uniref:acyclic terpene utilization AtuA family protein n=1 Tax=Umezawaea beigongshangensis TaxID=2780383 RepID=UPI0018F20EEF|nr:acyclic terpene utilization AtuA family protein [Umezawaea beigongshangensis]
MIRVGNASGFYGDRFSAVREMLQGGDLDFLTGDYLAELTMLILGRDRARDAGLGYARTFLRQMEDALGLALERGTRIVVNAGGLNPAGLARALDELADRLGLHPRVAHVTGDDLLDRAAEFGFGDPLTANAYLGAHGIADCLRSGADVVVTGRVTDAALVVGPAVAHFGWRPDDWDALAGAVVAGHVLECGAQATGGNFSFFGEVPGLDRPGFPIAELHADGSAVITKHDGTGGAVTTGTVTAQLLYEIGNPAYLGPDVVAHVDTAVLEQVGPDRVRISGVVGSPPPPELKVCLNTLGGFRNGTTFVLTGLDVDEKADLVRRQLDAAIGSDGLEWTLARVDRPDADTQETASALLHATIRTRDPARAKGFARAAVELALASYPGFHVTAPPSDGTPFGVCSAAFVPQSAVRHTAVLPGGARVAVAPPPSGPRRHVPPERVPDAPAPGSTRRVPLGAVVGARSGDKGGDANLGVWVRSDAAYRWLAHELTTARLRELLPETRDLVVDRYELPNLRALNFVLHGLLGAGVASSARFDPQAKALGEWLRCRHADVPEELL